MKSRESNSGKSKPNIFLLHPVILFIVTKLTGLVGDLSSFDTASFGSPHLTQLPPLRPLSVCQHIFLLPPRWGTYTLTHATRILFSASA